MLDKIADGDSTIMIWWSKNHLGMSDKQEIDHQSTDGSMTPTTVITANMTPVQAMTALKHKIRGL